MPRRWVSIATWHREDHHLFVLDIWISCLSAAIICGPVGVCYYPQVDLRVCRCQRLVYDGVRIVRGRYKCMYNSLASYTTAQPWQTAMFP